jgi:hypothetical protein
MADLNVHHSAADRHRRNAPRRALRISSSTRHFIRHYVKMVVAMFLGMAVLGMPAGWALGAAGSSWSGSTPTPPR